MKFEFRLQSSKEKKRKLIKRPKIFNLFKSRDVEKEIITGVPVSTDLFNRTLYTTPNGNFRALGDEYNLYSNVFQGQNNFVSLAPPREEDEEDTRPLEKLKRNIGTIIIPIPIPVYLWDLCYFAEDEDTYQITGYKTDLPLSSDASANPIFNPYDERYAETYPELADINLYKFFGFYNKTALMIGFFREYIYEEYELYRVDYDGNILAKVSESELVGVDSDDYEMADYTIYDAKFYSTYYDYSNDTINIFYLDENLGLHSVKTIESLSWYYSYIWKNFLLYEYTRREEGVLKYSLIIYDFINDREITEIDIGGLWDIRGELVTITDNSACLVYSSNDNLVNQHFIILNSDGTYKDIARRGAKGHIDTDGSRVAIFYWPHMHYSIKQSRGSFQIYNNKLFFLHSSLFYSNTGLVFNHCMSRYIRYILSDGRSISFGGWAQDGSRYRLDVFIFSSIDEDSIIDGVYSIYSNERMMNASVLQVENGDIIIYADTYNSPYRRLFYYSSDGENWEHISTINFHSFMYYLGGGVITNFNAFSAIRFKYGVISYDYGASWETWVYALPDDEPATTLTTRCYGEAHYHKPNTNEIYDALLCYSYFSPGMVNINPRIKIMKSTNGGQDYTQVGETYYFNIPEEEEGNPTAIYVKDNIILVALDPHYGHGGYRILRSFDYGQTWSMISNTFSITSFFGFNNLIFVNGLIYYSDNYGESWKWADQNMPGIVEIYNQKDYSLIDSFSVDCSSFDLQLFRMQDKIDTYNNWNNYSKLYKNHFYIGNTRDNKIIDLTTHALIDEEEDKYNNLFLGKYRFYSRYDELHDWNICLFMQDLDTGEEFLLKENYDPIFTMEHASTYYLR